jgi:outer membrane protein TolC
MATPIHFTRQSVDLSQTSTIELSGALGFDSVSANHLFSNKAFQPIGTGALSWRLFDFGKVDAEVTRTRGANAEALAQYRQAVLKTAEDVEDALISLSQTEARVEELQGEIDSLSRSAPSSSMRKFFDAKDLGRLIASVWDKTAPLKSDP